MAKKKKAAEKAVVEETKKADRFTDLNGALNKGKQKKMDFIVSAASGDFTVTRHGKFSSGDIMIDLMLGGGWERGRTHLVKGDFSTGKSKTLVQAASILTGWHKEPVLYVDYEGTSDPQWFEAMGADLKLLDFGKAWTAEEALQIIDVAFLSGRYSAIFLDSIASLSPKAEQDKKFEDATMALLAKLLTRFCRVMESRQNEMLMTGDKATTLFLVNQPRTPMSNPYGEYLPGGKQQYNSASTVVSFFRGQDISEGEKEDKIVYGFYSKLSTDKNKCGPPSKRATVGILTEPYEGHKAYSYYHGDSIFNLAKGLGLISQSGTWFEIVELGIKAQGQSKFRQMIVEKEEVGRYLVDAIKERLPFPVEFDYDYILRDVSEAEDGEDTGVSGKDAEAEVGEAGKEGS